MTIPRTQKPCQPGGQRQLCVDSYPRERCGNQLPASGNAGPHRSSSIC